MREDREVNIGVGPIVIGAVESDGAERDRERGNEGAEVEQLSTPEQRVVEAEPDQSADDDAWPGPIDEAPLFPG
jgi:hypothetical protein